VKDVLNRLERGRGRLKQWTPVWAEALAFYQNRQYVFTTRESGRAVINESDPHSRGETHRARTTRNFITPLVVADTSLATQRVPSYEVSPSSADSERVNAARLGEKLAISNYEKFALRRLTVDVYTYAICCGEGFARPFWNPALGAKSDLLNGGAIGDVEVELVAPFEIFWEPGCRFEDTRWVAIERAKSIDEIRELPGFTDVPLKANVKGWSGFVQGQLAKGAGNADMVLVTEYLELPSQKYPEGRRLMLADKKMIIPEEKYPYLNEGSNGFDHCIHRFRFYPTPDRDRDMGLVPLLIDPQRTLNDSVNKSVEWKNFALVPEMVAQVGSIRDDGDRKPGEIIYYQGDKEPRFRDVPPIPDSLFRMGEQAKNDIQAIGSQQAPPVGVESGKGLASWIENQKAQRAFVTQELADFHSGVMRHILFLQQQHYSEPRLIKINGRRGSDTFDFKGVDLRGEMDVRVLPASIEPRTKDSVRQQVMNYAQLGWVSPEQAMAAINEGTAEGLIDDYEQDIARQRREIRAMILAGMKPLDGEMLPTPPVEDYDQHKIHLHELETWMKTRDFELQPEPVREMAKQHRMGHQDAIDAEQVKEQAQQTMQAEQLGMENAAKPQAKPMPSLPSV